MATGSFDVIRPVAIRVVVVGPPLSASGGIGRVMSYTLGELAVGEVDYRVIDTRGSGSSPWSSLLPLILCCATLVSLGARRQVDVAHVNMSSHGSALRKGVILRVCRLVRIPVVLHLHASSFPEFFTPLPAWVQGWVRTTFRLAARVVVLGQVWRAYVQDVLGVPPENVTVLPNATKPAVALGAPRTPGEPLHLLFLGRLGPRKGVPELLEALADTRLRDCHWRATLAGDGDVSSYQERAAALGLESRVVFPGWVDTDAISHLLADAHVVTLPSHAEGMPMAVLEAFAAGLPVISTPVGSIPEVVLDEVNGLLVPVGDAISLADAILRLIEDESLRARLGAEALGTWRQHHSIELYALRLTEQWWTAARPRRRSGDRALSLSGG